MSDILETEKKALSVLIKFSFGNKFLSLSRILNQINIQEDFFYDILVLLYVHGKSVGRIEGKNFIFETYFPGFIPKPEVILGRQLTNLQLELLQNPPPNPFLRQTSPDAQKSIEIRNDAIIHREEEEADALTEMKQFRLEITPVYRSFQLILKILIQNQYQGSISDIYLRIGIPKGVRFFRVEQPNIPIESDLEKIELRINSIEIEQALNYDFVFILKDLIPIEFSGIIHFKNPNKTARFKKISSNALNLTLPKITPTAIPSFEVQKFLRTEGYYIGTRKFALFQTTEPLIVFNYLKDVARMLKMNMSHEEIKDDVYRAYFFGDIAEIVSMHLNDIDRRVCLIAHIESNTMGFTMFSKDERVIALSLTYTMKELSKRFTLGGALGGELLEMICQKCGTSIPEYFGTGAKHFCTNCGELNIFY